MDTLCISRLLSVLVDILGHKVRSEQSVVAHTCHKQKGIGLRRFLCPEQEKRGGLPAMADTREYKQSDRSR